MGSFQFTWLKISVKQWSHKMYMSFAIIRISKNLHPLLLLFCKLLNRIITMIECKLMFPNHGIEPNNGWITAKKHQLMSNLQSKGRQQLQAEVWILFDYYLTIIGLFEFLIINNTWFSGPDFISAVVEHNDMTPPYNNDSPASLIMQDLKPDPISASAALPDSDCAPDRPFGRAHVSRT